MIGNDSAPVNGTIVDVNLPTSFIQRGITCGCKECQVPPIGGYGGRTNPLPPRRLFDDARLAGTHVTDEHVWESVRIAGRDVGRRRKESNSLSAI
ncbi:MAG: hypothetical protein ACREX3_09585 [Gammaproteobacteria bacterium]